MNTGDPAIAMAKSGPQTEALRKRLDRMLADWNTEISAVVRALENQQKATETHDEKLQLLRTQADDLEELRQRVRDRDLALDYLKKKSKEKDQRIVELEEQSCQSRARIGELEQQLAALHATAIQHKGSQPIDHQAELEAMQTELAARKSLVKRLRADADRATLLAEELADSRNVIAKLNETITRLRSGPGRPHDAADTSAESHIDESMAIDGTRTIVIDMTESLRAAREARRRTGKKT